MPEYALERGVAKNQATVAELFFTPVLWPDFTEEDFAQALDEYARRERRFGLVKNNERIR
mgnify:CR=1 FL=1